MSADYGMAIKDMPDQQFVELLPDSLKVIAAVLSRASLLKLVESYGGQDLYVPFNRDPTSKLHQILGDDQMDLLRRQLGGGEFSVPKLTALKVMLRNKQIAADRHAGMTINDLVAKYALSARRIQDIVRSRPLNCTSNGC